ncbi:DNA polymerase III subunit delta [Clostridium beijerinckii]|uniref:DNA polymerase III subunit delta n=1 Tax=Clostridium beijerinckii TaxID=1520 RepID=UPI001493FFEE|nr:DNA polymerase-3 subunit delta [Clostridium beijerinckii]NYC04431.1 DNA polymerase-3 subunit delta [Clostridium beijerinckii]
MINYEVYEQEIEKGNIKNGYIFCGLDEEFIKDGINIIIKKNVPEEFRELNLIRIDGMNTSFDFIMNACETMPFMGEKKVVVVYRANFLQDKTDSSGSKIYNDLKNYISNLPPYTVLIMYYLLNDKRDRPNKNKKLATIGKSLTVVYCDKLKRDKYLKKVSEVFKEKGKQIGRTELSYFCEKVYNNFDIIKREADKLIAYCNEREIKKEDIDILISNSSEDDTFDLVELIATKKIDKAIDTMKEILYKSDQHMLIISAIQKHFLRLYEIKIKLSNGKKVDDFMLDYRLPQFVCEKLIMQTNKFTEKQLSELIKLCVNTETKLKSTGIDKNMEMEFLLINTLTVKK